MNLQKTNQLLDNAILILLTIQIASVSISIAVSSICFGTWIGLWLIQVIMSRKISFEFNNIPELKLISIFIGLYSLFEIMSRFFAVYPEGAFNNVKRLLLFLIFYVSIIKILTLRVLITIIIANVIAVSLISVVELINYGIQFNEMISKMPFSEIRIDYFNYPLTTSEIKMMTLLSVFPLLFIKEKFVISKTLLFPVLIPILISMLLTQSRNVFVASAICFALYGIIINRKFLAGYIIIIVLMWLFLPAEFTGRFRSILDPNHPSNAARLSMWKVGWQMFMDHPLTGVADSHIKEIYETYKAAETQGEGVHLHNNFIMILATTGIFGFLSFLGFMLTMFISQIKSFNRERGIIEKMLIFGSMLVFISFNISGIFEWTFGDHEVMTLFFFLTAVPFVLLNLRDQKANDYSS